MDPINNTLRDTLMPSRSMFLAFCLLAIALMPPTAAWAQSNTQIAPGDVVSIQVYGHPNLTVTTPVASDGTVNYPLVGQVRIGGLTVIQAGKAIANALEQGGYIKRPAVTVYITQNVADQLSVLGQVGRPGRYAVNSHNDGLFDVLAMAGGLKQSAAEKVVIIRPKREGAGHRIAIDIDRALRNGDSSEDVRLQPGDVVYVPHANMVYIYGQVNRSGAYPISRDMTIRQLIALAGGLTKGGTTSGIKVTIRINGKSKTKTERLSTLVIPGEVVYIPQSLF